jgi:ectoine hydroxylase-related dioxygenase (phytanoyl-CoA dioxygenase family)
VSLELPIPFGLQGLLYLSDTREDQGAFTLVPGFQNKIEAWINSLPPGTNPRTENLYALGPKSIAANAGDFILWHQALPHGSSPNTAALPRLVQYINYMPIDAGVKDKWT